MRRERIRALQFQDRALLYVSLEGGNPLPPCKRHPDRRSASAVRNKHSIRAFCHVPVQKRRMGRGLSGEFQPESSAFNVRIDMAYFLRIQTAPGGRRIMEEFNANTERSSTAGQRHPLFRWIVFLCVLLLAVLVLQVVILFRTNKLAYERQGPVVPRASLTHSAAQPTECPRATANANIPQQPPRPPRDNWPSQMNSAFNNDAQRMFERMDSTFANAFLNMRRADPFAHFDDGWDRLVTSPGMDMREHDNKYVVLCYLPTVSPSNVSVTINGRMLTVSSTAREWDGTTAETSSFQSRVQIPGPVGDLQQATASLSNGVLKIIIPKGSATIVPANAIVKLM
jgi:HSP20 family molecular chaperone IbpA